MQRPIFDVFQRLRGKRVWTVIPSFRGASNVSIEFGDRRVRDRPLKRDAYRTSEECDFAGEITLLVTCSWRLDGPDRVICGGLSSAPAYEEMVQSLRQMIGREVEFITVLEPALDLEIHVAGGLRFLVFCDAVEGDQYVGNYTLFADQTYNVGVRSALAITPRTS
jgi:hypothetical protein